MKRIFLVIILAILFVSCKNSEGENILLSDFFDISATNSTDENVRGLKEENGIVTSDKYLSFDELKNDLNTDFLYSDIFMNGEKRYFKYYNAGFFHTYCQLQIIWKKKWKSCN